MTRTVRYVVFGIGSAAVVTLGILALLAGVLILARR